MTPEEAVRICDRNFGIGGDGIIFALPGSNGCDYTMRMFNSDGTEPQMCGNGIRCMAKFLQEIEGKSGPLLEELTYTIHTLAGTIVATITIDGLVCVDMGEPILTASQVPCTLAPTREDRAVDSTIVIGGKEYLQTAVSMGNPHGIIYVDKIKAMDPPFETVGPLAEAHEAWPEKVNAEFIEVYARDHVRMMVWERGAGPTLACGTGACAVCVAGVLTGRTDRNCKVTLPGGDLQIHWDEHTNKLFMTGPAVETFRGTLA